MFTSAHHHQMDISDILDCTPSLCLLLQCDPPCAYFTLVAFAILEVAMCYGYGYPYRYLSHTLFSTFVYLCLPSDFSPFTIIKYLLPCYFAIEQGPMYLVNLRDKFSQQLLYTCGLLSVLQNCCVLSPVHCLSKYVFLWCPKYYAFYDQKCVCGLANNIHS